MSDINPIAYFVVFMFVLCLVTAVVFMHREERWHHNRKRVNEENHQAARLAGDTRYEYTDPYGSVSLRGVTA